MKSTAQKRKEKAQQRLQNSAAKSRTLTELFAASIISNNNLTETGQSVMKIIIQLQRQGFLAFAAANLSNISSEKLYNSKCNIY